MSANRSYRSGGRQSTPSEDDDLPDIVDEETGELITDDTPEVIDAEPTDDPAPDGEPEPDAVALLQRSLDETRAERDAARRDRQAALDHAATLETRANSAEDDQEATAKAMLTTAQANARNELLGAKQAYAAARAANDHLKEADALELIADKRAAINRFTDALADFDEMVAENKRKAPAAPAKPAPVENVQFDAGNQQHVDALMNSFTPSTKAWAERNKADLFKDTARTDQAFKVHAAAVQIGHAPDSPEYFKFMDQQLGYDKTATITTPHTPRKKAPIMTAAPVNRNTPPAANTVSLSADERNMAKRLNLTPAQYGKYKKQAIDGANNPDYTGPRYSKDDPAIGRR